MKAKIKFTISIVCTAVLLLSMGAMEHGYAFGWVRNLFIGTTIFLFFFLAFWFAQAMNENKD
jgi:hypothetical protein